ncbi:major histocompatibility complex class I-related gene protein isoform X1 [Salmo salar]|uniref:Major histocompatibility complex class I-related gene protein isoform X1 n=3 Tax=Salmo salar TaxID=8030 RepID=A0A1S3PYN4_SALSA|nr:major histocompatibility complex class I-related gene protein isoform X1 [Salmo salar]
MKCFILLLLSISLHAASAAMHSLRYVYTATSGMPDFPEFVTVGLVNGEPISYYDSIIRRETPRQDWMKEAVDPDYWNRNTQTSIGDEQTFKANIDVAKQRFNQTGGVHVYQNMYGCEWDDEAGVTEGFDQYGYDGEDFLAFDLKTLKWIAPTPQAVITKLKWDNNMAQIQQDKHYLTQTCIEWLKKYLDYGKSTLMRTVPPSVSLLQKTPSSPVTCHATGFYPSGVMVSWQKDGQDHHEDVEYGETLQNDDGTFQKSSHLTVTPEEWKNNKYQCVVQVTGVKEDFIKVLTESEIKTNWGNTNIGFVPANTSDVGSNSSHNTAPKE